MDFQGENIMKLLQKLLLAASLLVTSSAFALTAPSSFSETGTLGFDDSVDTVIFTVDSIADVTMETFGYGGGTQADGNVVFAGGFDPILTLFTLAGELINYNDDSGYGATDPATFSAYDSGFTERLSAGTYVLAISQYSNFANGPDIINGFDGSGRTDFGGRTSAYAYDVTLSAVPVPAAGILFGSALLAAGAFGRRKKKAKASVVGAFARAS